MGAIETQEKRDKLALNTVLRLSRLMKSEVDRKTLYSLVLYDGTRIRVNAYRATITTPRDRHGKRVDLSKTETEEVRADLIIKEIRKMREEKVA